MENSLQEDLNSCLRIAEYMFEKTSQNEFLWFILQETLKRLNADRGSIFLIDKKERILRGFAMTGIREPGQITVPLSEGIVGHVTATGEVLNIHDAYSDARFYPAIDKQTGYKTRCILCSPIKSRDTKSNKPTTIWGALEILNPKQKDFFDDKDEISLENILSFAAVRLNDYQQMEDILHKQEKLEQKLVQLKGYFDENNPLEKINGTSEAVVKLKQMIWSSAPFDSNVFIRGESGTGKELVAHCIHALSPRVKEPFVAINCAAIPETLLEAELFGIESGVATGVTRRIGKIEQAHKGTLFLDEVADMPLGMQAKLLRVIQEKEITRVGGKENIHVDVRIVCATHKDLTELILNKTFRQDLYYRLHVVEILVPALKTRKNDIAILANHFLDKLNQHYENSIPKRFSPDIITAFEKYTWPGNVRELQNEVERLFVISGAGTDLIEAKLLEVQKFNPISEAANLIFDSFGNILFDHERGILHIVTKGKTLPNITLEIEKEIVENTLEKHQGNKSKVAEELGISREGLRKMLIRWKPEIAS